MKMASERFGIPAIALVNDNGMEWPCQFKSFCQKCRYTVINPGHVVHFENALSLTARCSKAFAGPIDAESALVR